MSGVGVTLESEYLPGGEEAWLVVVSCEKAGKVVGEIEVRGAVASCECGCGLVGVDLISHTCPYFLHPYPSPHFHQAVLGGGQ